MAVASVGTAIVTVLIAAAMVRLFRVVIDDNYAALVHAEVPRVRTLLLGVGMHAVSCVLAVLAALTTWRCHPKWGPTTTNAYVVVELGVIVLMLTALRTSLGLATVVRVVYALVSLYLVNVRFSRDFAIRRPHVSG